MDEDELLYREMNPEDGFYMGDEEYEEVEYEEEVPEETGTREISIFSDEYMAMLDARIAELEAQAAARKAAENRYAALRNKRAAENSQPKKPEAKHEKPSRKLSKKQKDWIFYGVLTTIVVLVCGYYLYKSLEIVNSYDYRKRQPDFINSQEEIFTPPVRDTTTDVKYIGPDGEIVGEEKAATIKADYSLPVGYRDGYEDGYEDGCNHERGGSYAPRQRGSKYRSDYAEGYAEGYYDGFQDMAEDYDSEGVYDDEEAELD